MFHPFNLVIMETKKNEKVRLYDLIEAAWLDSSAYVDFYLEKDDFLYSAKVCSVCSWTDPVLVHVKIGDDIIHYTFPAYLKVYPA